MLQELRSEMKAHAILCCSCRWHNWVLGQRKHKTLERAHISLSACFWNLFCLYMGKIVTWVFLPLAVHGRSCVLSDKISEFHNSLFLSIHLNVIGGFNILWDIFGLVISLGKEPRYLSKNACHPLRGRWHRDEQWVVNLYALDWETFNSCFQQEPAKLNRWKRRSEH